MHIQSGMHICIPRCAFLHTRTQVWRGLQWVGGGGFWVSEAPKKGRTRGAFTRARIR